ncbi:MAG TPA: GNAT family N-acetyltransferase [Streptosporangiaceae bacterium]|jgi:RimJ/RimL family protein N-acetyltransferase
MIQAEAITTERLVLEPLAMAHAEEMFRVLADPGLYAFTGGGPPTLAELLDRYARQLAGPPPGQHETWLNWVLRLRADDRLVGYVQATLADARTSIAWVVGAPWQGRGLAAEAAQALVGWLQEQGIDPITASIHPGHDASQAVARRAGLEPTAARDGDEIVWSVTGGPR